MTRCLSSIPLLSSIFATFDAARFLSCENSAPATRKSVVSILEQHLDQQPLPTPAPAATLPAHANVRGPEYYQPQPPEDTVACSTTPH